MNYRYDQFRERKRLVWGLLCIGGGLFFLLHDPITLSLGQLWTYWPLLISTGGVVTIFCASRARHIRHGLFHLALGLWLFVCLNGLWGFTFAMTWPFLLILAGASMLLRAVFEKNEPVVYQSTDRSQS